MLDPYKLVLVNIILFAIFLIAIPLLRKVKNYHFLLLLVASCLPLFSLLRKGVHESGDFAINISKSVDLYNSLSHGIFPVHWASLLNATYGYPLFLFTYPLPYYSIVFFKFLGFSFISSEKIIIALVYILSGIGMYLLLKSFFKPLNSLLGAVLYLYAPYHLVDMHYRTALGECFAFAFLPFVFYFIVKLSRKISLFDFILLIVSYSCLILSHQAITLVTFPLIILFTFFLKVSKKKLLLLFSAIVFSFLITAFYWLPVIDGINYTHQKNFAKDISFEVFNLFLFSPWKYGLLYQGPVGQISFPLGIVQLVLLITGIFLFISGKIKSKYKTFLLALYIVFSVVFFLLLPITEPLWKLLPFMTNFQFSYRLMLPLSFIVAIIGTVVSLHFNNTKIVYIFIIFTMGSTILNWGTRAMLTDITDSYLISRVPYSTFEAEGLQPAAPIYKNPDNIWFKTPPENHLEIVRGKSTIKNLNRTPITHSYIIEVFEPTEFVENTAYFPGWNLYVNSEDFPFKYEDIQKTGLIRFTLNPGRYNVNLVFEHTGIVKFANFVSIISIISLIIYTLFLFHKRK